MRPYDKEIENIKKQIINQYHPSDIILFGSCAKGQFIREATLTCV